MPQEADVNLEEKLALVQRELSESLERQAATDEILRVISNELEAVFDATLANAVRICQQYGFTRDECDRLLRFRQNIDELIAHDLGPPFTLPARFRSKAALIWVSHLAGRLGKSPLEMADHYCVHPALASVLESANWESMDDEEIERCYRSNVSGKPGPEFTIL
jgi:hypothetical protein